MGRYVIRRTNGGGEPVDVDIESIHEHGLNQDDLEEMRALAMRFTVEMSGYFEVIDTHAAVKEEKEDDSIWWSVQFNNEEHGVYVTGGGKTPQEAAENLSSKMKLLTEGGQRALDQLGGTDGS